MPAFALPQAVSPQVAATLSRFAHYPVLDRVYQRARTYDITPMAQPAARAKPSGLPEQLTLIFDGRDRSKPTQLHYGRLPVHPRFWSYDANRGILFWNFRNGGADHTGKLTFAHGASTGFGNVTVGKTGAGVRAALAPITYSCDVGITSAASATGTAPALSLHWDASDPRWSGATWIANALTFIWQLTGEVIVGQPTSNIAVSFVDPQTNAQWSPDTTTFSALVDANLRCTMMRAGGHIPAANDRGKLPAPASSIASVFPYIIAFDIEEEGTGVTGALLTGQQSQAGTVLGFRGTVVNPSVTGLYNVSSVGGTNGAIAVYAGRLYVDDVVISTSSMTGSRLAWSGLSAPQQQRSGLPESGAIGFSNDAARFQIEKGPQTGRRVRAEQVARQYAGTPLADHPAIAASNAVADGMGLTLQGLSQMTQFAFVNNAWVDVVQQNTMSDFHQMLLYYMPDDLRQSYYNVSQPFLPTWLQSIAAQGDSPAAWYQSLATAYLTNVLSTFPEAGANQLNAARAQTWLKSKTAASQVFQQHTTAIYGRRFSEKLENAILPKYLADQATPPSNYAAEITADAAQWQEDLRATIRDPGAQKKMLQTVEQLSSLAISANLYWAYTYFRYLTAPEELMVLRMIILGNATDLDGSAFMRQCQTNAAILNLLDPSNTFSQHYLHTIKSFQICNVLPSLFDFSGADADHLTSNLRAILGQTANAYQGDSNPQIAAAAGQAQTLAQDSQLRDYVLLAQSIAASGTGQGAWNQIAPAIESELGGKIGPGLMRLFMAALAGVGIMGIVYGVMQWNKLSQDQQAMIIANGAAFAIHFISAFVEGGFTVGELWDDYSIGNILSGLLTDRAFEQASSDLESGLKKWLISRDVYPEYLSRYKEWESYTDDLLEDFKEKYPDDEGFVTRFFGRNLEDFLATRLAAAVAIVNLVLTIHAAIQAQDPLERIADILMASAAGIEALASTGAWMLGAAGIAEFGGFPIATICSVCGVLSVLAALAGVGILLYLIYRPRQTPVQQFSASNAKNAGFLMSNGCEIDYFVGYSNGNEPARLGCSFVTPSSAEVLSVSDDGTTAETAPQSYGYKSVFSITTDGSGQSRILALVPDSSGALQTKLLTWAASNAVSFQAPLRPNDPNYNTQLWSIILQSAPEMDGTFPSSGVFTVNAVGTNMSLVWNGTSLVLGSGPAWLIQQVSMAVAGLSMPDMRLYTFMKGKSFNPVLAQPGSPPMTWTVTPGLPSFLALDTTSGRISQTNTSDLPVEPPKAYTISVTNGVGTAPPPASFTIEVDAPPS